MAAAHLTASVAAIVLFAALLHATWNAVVKGAGDRTVVLGLVALGHVVPGLVMVSLAPLPAVQAVPFIIASTVIHWAYYYGLNLAYRLGDLSLVYPVSRGLAPVLIALGAQVWVGERLPWVAWAGILCVSVGIMLLTARQFRRGVEAHGLGAALAVAVIVAAYSIVDGVGVRGAGTALGYVGWLFVAEICVVAYVFATRHRRLRAMPRRSIALGFAGGVLSGAAYGLVLYAKTLAPLGVVSALRETSVIFAALIGVWLFGEGPRRIRLVAAGIVVAGIVPLALAK